MRTRTTLAIVAAMLVAATPTIGGAPTAAQDATPAPAYSCEAATTPGVVGTPMAMGGDMAGMGIGTSTAGMDHAAMGLDLMYIDMMIPHHASIIAMAQAALPRLGDERLREIAQAIVAAQQSEVKELRAMREAISGEVDPMPMDEATMAAMDELMPGMPGTMKEMAFQMDAAAQVAAVCAAKDTDLTLIELTIPHHQMAIEASRAVVEQSENAELRDFAQRVIAAQQQEIDALTAIREELTGAATPTAAGEASAHSGVHHDGPEMALAAEMAPIRALPGDVVAQIERGEGAGFALPAERNGVPGPRHVLDLAAELGLSAEQRTEVQAIYDTMQSAAIPAGSRYLAAQSALEADFRAGTIDLEWLPGRMADVSRLEAELATIHLAAHIQTAEVLSADQIAAYAELRQSA